MKLTRQQQCAVLRDRGWKWIEGYWVLEKHGVRISVYGYWNAFSLTVEPLKEQ